MVALTYERRIGERRSTPPVSIEWLPIWGRGPLSIVDGGEEAVEGVVIDVSVSGAALDLRDVDVQPGDVAYVSFDGVAFEVWVRRTEPETPEGTTRVGVEFVHLEPDTQSRLFGYLGRGRPDERTWLSRRR